jgi:hypothetical protein
VLTKCTPASSLYVSFYFILCSNFYLITNKQAVRNQALPIRTLTLYTHKFKGRSMGPIQHGSLKADCTLAPEIVPSFISRGAPHQAAQEASTSEGRKPNPQILPAPRNLLQVLGSFTCPEVGTWGRLFNFPSEGRHFEEFYI